MAELNKEFGLKNTALAKVLEQVLARYFIEVY